MKLPLFLFAPDATAATVAVPAPNPTAPTQSRGPFDKAIMANLVGYADIVANAKKTPYAEILATKYKITGAQIATLGTDIAECERLFGSARQSDLSSQSGTLDKHEAHDDIIDAINEFRTGARLTFKSHADMEAFGVDVDLEKNSDVLAQLARTILDDARSPTLDGIGPDEMTALQSALDNWIEAGGEQGDNIAQSVGDHARGVELFESIKPRVRRIKIAMNGKFSYKKLDNREARKLFHLPPTSQYAPRAGEKV